MLLALTTVQRLFAPFLPFAAEEVWSWWQPGSVHTAAWPADADIVDAIGSANEDAIAIYATTSEVLAAIRRSRSEAGLPGGAQLERVLVRSREDLAARLGPAAADLRTAVRAEALEFIEDPALETLAVEIVPKAQERGA
jgi:valyl-tRNA synthetase